MEIKRAARAEGVPAGKLGRVGVGAAGALRVAAASATAACLVGALHDDILTR